MLAVPSSIPLNSKLANRVGEIAERLGVYTAFFRVWSHDSHWAAPNLLQL